MKKAETSRLKETENVLKPRKGLKLLSALTLTAPIFLESGQKAFAIQHLAGGLPKTITVKDKSMGQSSMAVVTTSKKGHTEAIHGGFHDGNNIRFYCLQPMKLTPPVGTTLRYDHQDNGNVRAVMRAGFGLNSAEDLGYPGQAQACEYGTQVAVWVVSGAINPHKIVWKNKTAHAVYNKIMANYKKAVYRGDGLTTLHIKEISTSKDGRTKTLEAVTKENKTDRALNVKIKSSGVSIVQGGKTKTATVKSNTPFEVTLDKGQKTGTVKATTTGYKTVGAVYKPTNSAYQMSVGLVAVKDQPLADSYTWNHETPAPPAYTPVEVTTPAPTSSASSSTPAPDTPEKTSEKPKPKMHQVTTKATNAETGKQVMEAKKGAVDINEGVTMTDLQGGQKYRINSWLVDKETGKSLMVDGKQVSAQTEYTAPDSGQGTVNVKLTIPDASNLGGHKLVAFTDVALESDSANYTAKHENLSDEDETVEFTKPEIGTTAKNAETGGKDVLSTNNEQVIDTVRYNGLISGNQYTVVGTIYDKDTGKPVQINGENVVGTSTFTATQANGTIDVPFNFNASGLRGKRLVVFEDLFAGKSTDNQSPVAIHHDINDKGQSFNVLSPALHTTLSHDNQKAVTADKENTVNDKVQFSNVIPGLEYKVSGRLVDKDTGKTVVDKNGNPVEASASFKATQASGTINVPFKFDGSKYKGKSIVAFENLYHNGKLVTNHANINDTAQTIGVQEQKPAPIKTTASNNTPKSKTPVLPQTGNTSDKLGIGIGISAIVVVLGSIVLYTRRNQTTGLDY